MTNSLNKVFLIGNLGRDPELKLSQDGTRIVSLSLATSEVWKDKTTGERKERTEWHRVVIFNEKLAEICEKNLSKGSYVYIEGQLQSRKWVDQKGQKHNLTEIVVPRFKGELTILDSRSSLSLDRENITGDQNRRQKLTSGSSLEIDDRIPF